MIGSTIKSRQYALFTGILFVTAFLSTAGYHTVHRDRVLFRKAEMLFRSKDYALAERAYLQALEIRPGLLRARLSLAELYTWTKRYEEAVSLYRAILEDQPAFRSARVRLARVLAWKGDLDEAIKEYRIVLGE
ncbi:MAG: tetratricopeptide repeat protein [Deltaproteobacteria bacterium]|nr:tetratricopeptide repeat protein [Deltaproteobacteria bacterium]